MIILSKRIACALLLSVLPVAIGGCATFGLTPTSSSPRQVKVVDVGTKKLRPYATRPGDTCETQREAAAENTVRDNKPGKQEFAYCSFCDCPHLFEGASDAHSASAPGKDAPAPEPAKPDPSTS